MMYVFYHNKEVITFFNVTLSGGWIEESKILYRYLRKMVDFALAMFDLFLMEMGLRE